MPRNVRNFWVKATVDGRPAAVEFGPRSKDGGMTLTLFVRERGQVRRALNIWCREHDGALLVDVEPDELDAEVIDDTGADTPPVVVTRGDSFLRVEATR